MTRFALRLAACALSLSAGASLAQAPGQPDRLQLGVTTHFGQGWPARYWDYLASSDAGSVRDSVSWNDIEKVKGTIAFTPANTSHIRRSCDMGKRVLLGMAPRHRRYDSNQTVFSAPAKAAFVRYVAAVADHFGDCVEAIEIGNEVNAKAGITGPAARNRVQSYTELLRLVHQAVKPTHPRLQLLGGSTNAIGTGFLIKLFDAGALAYMDGVVVHPYRRDPANVDWELDRLRQAIASRGSNKPIWVTEFSRDFATPDDAAPFLAKMATLMSASGVSRAYWYALVDQAGFPTMGLYTTAGAVKPAGSAFRYFATEVLPRGAAVRVGQSTGGSLSHFRFGSDVQIVWGARRAMTFSGPAVFRDATGRVVPRPSQVTDEPVIVTGRATIAFGPPQVLADSLLDFAREPWSYFARRGSAIVPLGPIDWTWTSFIGSPLLRPVTVAQHGIAPGGTARLPLVPILRFTAKASAQVFASACLTRLVDKGDGVRFELWHNGRSLSRTIVQAAHKSVVPIRVAPGDTIDFAVGPNATPVLDANRYRFRVALTPDTLECS